MKQIGSCHCGAVKLEANLDLNNVAQCNCSICIRKGTPMVLANNLEITEGQENLGCYQFSKMIAEHFFCKTCGIYTHHRPMSAPDKRRVNAGCFENINLDELNIIQIDGKSF